MATNKHAQIRYKILDSCFRNTGRNYSFNDLIDSINEALAEVDSSIEGISIRTLRDDISFMESELGWSADIERFKIGKKWFYRYRDPNFSINNQPLNKTELTQINSALEIISRFNGMPQFNWVNEIVTKINNGFELKENSSAIISFDHNQYLKGIEYLGELFNCIHAKKTIYLNYRPFTSNKDLELLIHPYYLKQYNNRWFLFGLNEAARAVHTFALDRINAIKESGIKFKKNKSIDFEEYFEDIIGVTRPPEGKLTTIEMKFTSEESPYILTKPLHGSQKKKKVEEDGVTITIEIIPNVEFEKMILSFGEKVKIVKPKKIAELFQNKYKKAIDNYKIKSKNTTK